jgi:hypothetical protein
MPHQRMLPYVNSIPSVPLIVHRGEYKEVHPCRVEFLLTDTKLYRTAFATLRDCANRQDNGKMGIAFWPLSRLRDTVVCGLVWPNMALSGDQGAKLGTCFLGPQNPKYITFVYLSCLLLNMLYTTVILSRGYHPVRTASLSISHRFIGCPS